MKVIIGSETCPKCFILKKELEDKGETFKYIDANSLAHDELTILAMKHGLNLPIIYEE